MSDMSWLSVNVNIYYHNGVFFVNNIFEKCNDFF